MRSSFARRAVVVFLCASLLTPMLPPPVRADTTRKTERIKTDGVVRVEIGKPSIWSLAQAHYLLGQLHDRNRDLIARRPGEDALDPNRANASRLEILRTLLGVEAELDESAAVKNDIELSKFEEKQARKTQAQGLLAVRKSELQELDEQIAELSIRIARLEAEHSFAATPPSEEDRQRKIAIAEEKKRLEFLQARRTSLAGEITSLESTAIGDVTTPELETPSLSESTSGATGTLPASEALTAFITKAMSETGTPSLSASIALDNYVHIQYEIIAKQLTLLRDEVGPDERVVFLELPASFYTIDKRANRYVAQVDWEVSKIYDEEPSPEVQLEIICRDLRDEGKSPSAIRTILKTAKGIGAAWYELGETPCLRWLQRDALAKLRRLPSPDASGLEADSWRLNQWQVEKVSDDFSSELNRIKARSERASRRRNKVYSGREDESCDLDVPLSRDVQGWRFPITMEMLRLEQARKGNVMPVDGQPAAEGDPTEEEKKTPAYLARNETQGLVGSRVRTLEIIPRQSALNVNQHHAQTSYKGILGALKFLSGFGAKVTYQSQKELYENFLQQEIFASGYGKGRNSFGWTFGPQPGSQRISPGQRTTYAILAVPKNALGLELKASGRAFRRRWKPEQGDKIADLTFQVRIPNEKTERLWVESLSYTPVRRGPVTVHLRGNYFSPQLGVLVNGVPLTRSISISRATTRETAFTRTNSGVEGEFEISNSREMVLNFSMGPDFVGTPIITLITPERSTAINSFALRINFRNQLESLKEVSEHEPMFLDKLELTPKLEELGFQALSSPPPANCKGDGFTLARIRGKGLLPEARISVAGAAPLPIIWSADSVSNHICNKNSFALQESTGSYMVFFLTPQAKRWKIRVQQATKQGVEENEFEHVLPAGVDFGHRIRSYRRGRSAAEVDLTFVVPEARENPEATVLVYLTNPSGVGAGAGTCTEVTQRDGKDFRGNCRILFEGGAERDFVTLQVLSSLPPSPLGAEGPPQITARFADLQLPVRSRVRAVVNQRTNTPRADSRQDARAVLTGENLSRVTGVLFGEQSATIISHSPDVIVVQVPRLKVEPGQGISVPVTVQTDAGALTTGFYFTYDGPPEPKK